jgi:O-antigen/teichoic acid export membrane protein
LARILGFYGAPQRPFERSLHAATRALRFCTTWVRLPLSVVASDDRNKERYKRAARSIVFNAVSAGLGLAVLLLSVSLTLPYLGQERFGIWMTISSVAAILSILDLGVGNGLVNLVATAKSAEDHQRLRTIVSRGIWLLAGIGAVAALVLVSLLNVLDLGKLIKMESQFSAREAEMSATVFILLFCLNIPLGGARKVLQGLQRAWEPHIASAFGYACSLLLLYVCATYRAPIPFLICATYGMQVLASIGLLIRLYREDLLRGNFLAGDGSVWGDWKGLFSTGSIFVAMQIGTMCGWGCDGLIVSSILGASEVGKLAIAQRLFQVLKVLVAMLTAPLWGLYADAHARGDKACIRNTLKLSMLGISLISLAMSGVIVLASPWLLKVWIGSGLHIPEALLWAVGVSAILESIGSVLAMFLNGVNELKSQLFAAVIFCALALPLKIVLLMEFRSVAWVIWSTVFASLFADYLVYLALFRRRIFKHASLDAST